jgi:hypothetical protein
METHFVDQAFTVIGRPANIGVEHHRTINYNLHMAIGITTGIAFYVQVNMVPLPFVEAAA